MDPIELEYDSQDNIPEAFRPLFEEKDGKFFLTKIKGLKTQKDVDAVKEGLRKEREDHKKTSDALKAWGELKPEEVQAQLDRIKELEAAAADKLDEDKINEIVEGRLAQKTGPLDRKIKELEGERDTLTEENTGLKSSIESRDRNDSVRAAATESKAHITAVPDIEMAASMMLEKDDSGNWVTKDGIDGLTPGLDVKGWMKEMVEIRPHWWPESEGGGSRGGSAIKGYSGKNPFSKEHWNVTQQGQVVREHGRDMADKLASAAGTVVGGSRPK